MTKCHPLVSILTPTCNRRLFIPQYLRNLRRQQYPGPIEVVIADDGDDSVEDLIRADPRVRYLRLTTRTPLGTKRNMLAAEARGQVLVHMDDDDYYPPSRVSHAVTTLLSGDALIAGSSQMYIYDTATDRMAVSGPFGACHATAATFAYRREYLIDHKFNDAAKAQEEPGFTNGFSVPMIQLDPRMTILVIRHAQNTWDKSRTATNRSELKLKNFVRDTDDRRFYRHQLAKLLAANQASD
jgi:glycosyltransferase involved in cell wall biosynthesis